MALTVVAALTSCATSPACPTEELDIEGLLGADEAALRKRMSDAGAIDITDKTDLEYRMAAFGEQKYLWYERPDGRVVAVLFHGERVKELRVVLVEVSSPGLGLEGIKRFRSNVEKKVSLID